jgi:hypothetical protein
MSGIAVPTMQKKDDALTTVMKGLQIAQSVYGIKTDMAKLDQYEQDQADKKSAAEDTAKGIVTPAQAAELQKTHDLSASPLTGSVKLMMRDDQGNESPLYATVRKRQEPAKTREVETVDAKGRPVRSIVPDVAGASYPAYVKPEKAAEDKTPQNTVELRKEYNGLPTTKNTAALTEHYQKVETAGTKQTPNGASDMSLIYSYMKMLDPNSTVREGEYASAEQAASIPQKIIEAYNKARDGEKLLPEIRQNFVDQARDLMQSQLELQANQDARYSDLAKSSGIDPVAVLDPMFGKVGANLAKARAAKKATPSDGSTAFADVQDEKPVVVPNPLDDQAALFIEKNKDSQDPIIKAKVQKIRELNGLSP